MLVSCPLPDNDFNVLTDFLVAHSIPRKQMVSTIMLSCFHFLLNYSSQTITIEFNCYFVTIHTEYQLNDKILGDTVRLTKWILKL
jgi:hypothetical protein